MPNPACPPSSGRCVFFVLPRELRDEIYRLALTSPRNSTLFYRSSVRFYCGTYTAPATSGHKPSFTSAPNSSTRIPFNTLQYVCRQLREETRGLHLILNNLEFTDQNPARINSCRAVDFFHGCSEHILSKICNVEIEEGFPRPARGISSADRRYLLDADWFKRSFVLTSILHIRQVCKSHPKLNVRIRLRKMTLISKAHMTSRISKMRRLSWAFSVANGMSFRAMSARRGQRPFVTRLRTIGARG
jgi:hypothetical protein